MRYGYNRTSALGLEIDTEAKRHELFLNFGPQRMANSYPTYI